MQDNHTSSADDFQRIQQPQLPPGPADITFKTNWTGKDFGRKATQLRKAPDEIPETVQVVEVSGDLGAAIKGHGSQDNRIIRGGLTRQDCMGEAIK